MVQRRNYFIKKKFQINFIYRFIVLILIELALAAGLFLYVSRNTLTTGYIDSILRIERTPNFFFVSFLFILLIVGVGITLAGMMLFTLLSHRIAGPLYRFEQHLKGISEGDLTKRINLRRTDQLTEMKESFNTVIDSLDRRLGVIKNRLAEAQNLLSKKDDPEHIAKLNKTIELLKKELEHFKVTSDFKE